MKNFSHLLQVNESMRKIEIYRIDDESNKKQFYSSVDFPNENFQQNEMAFREFARLLGENLLLDSPAARKLLGL